MASFCRSCGHRVEKPPAGYGPHQVLCYDCVPEPEWSKRGEKPPADFVMPLPRLVPDDGAGDDSEAKDPPAAEEQAPPVAPVAPPVPPVAPASEEPPHGALVEEATEEPPPAETNESPTAAAEGKAAKKRGK